MSASFLRSTLMSAAVAGAVALLAPAAGLGATPTFQVTDAGPAVSGFSTADEVASELLGPGVSLSGAATINGSASTSAYASALPSFGRFTLGDADLGISDGLLIGANSRASSFATATTTSHVAADRDDADLYDVINAAGLCAGGGAAACVNNATSVEFAVTPTARYLKFEYALAITEVGSYNGGSGLWGGDVFSYPDGFALFVGGRQVADNCAVVPRTSTYMTMQTGGIVAPAGGGGTNRASAQSNLDARAADEASPPVTPVGFSYSTENAQWTVKFLSVPLTCVADVNTAFLAGTPAQIKIVVADANDSSVSPAVFLKGGSVRFSSNQAPTPAADPAPAPAPAPTPAPPPAAEPTPAPTSPPGTFVTPLAPPAIHTPTAADADGRVLVVHRVQFDAVGRYTFIYTDASGRRITQLPGSRVGVRTLTRRSSAPVLRNQKEGRRIVLAGRFDPKVFARSGSVGLRIIRRAPDGSLTEVTVGADGGLS